MSKIKLLTIAVFSLLLLNLGTLAFVAFKKPHGAGPGTGRGPGTEHGPKGEGPKHIIIERLNFDEKQQKQYELIIEEHRNKMHQFNDSVRELRDELYSLLVENAPDTVKANVIMEKIAVNQKGLDKLNFEHFQKIKAICKPGQVERFNGLVDDLTHLFSPHGGPPR